MTDPVTRAEFDAERQWAREEISRAFETLAAEIARMKRIAADKGTDLSNERPFLVPSFFVYCF